MMATLTAIAVASSSVAIRPFCAHQPSLGPDLGAARPRPWLLDLAIAQIWATARASGGHGRGRDPVLRCRGPPAGDWLIAWWSGAGSAGSASPRGARSWGPRSRRARAGRGSNRREFFLGCSSFFFLGKRKKMERSTPVRKPHTSTSDLLTWSETPPPHDSVAPGSASSRSNARSHQPSDGISKVVFGGQVTTEKSENLNKRKSCSAYKLKEITGSGIFAANGEDDLLEPGSANPASNNKTGLKMYQVAEAIGGVWRSSDYREI